MREDGGDVKIVFNRVKPPGTGGFQSYTASDFQQDEVMLPLYVEALLDVF